MFNYFPYSNAHELNLDWILAAIEKLNTTGNLDSIYNVKHYGAVGDGITDDSAAINDAINAVGNPGYIYFPPGEYFCSAAIHATNTSFIGAGKQITFLTFDGTNGLDLVQAPISGTSGTGCIEIAEMTLWQRGQTGTAIIINGQIPGDRTTQAPVIHDIKIMGSEARVFQAGWYNGIEIVNCNGATIDRVSLTGSVDSILGEPNYNSNRAIYLHSDVSPKATDYKITNSFINYWDYALLSTIYEGIHFINNTVVGCYIGIDCNNSTQDPLIIIDCCHFNTAYYCIDLRNVKEIIISNTSFYHALVPTGIADGFGVYCEDCITINIHDCQFMNLATNNMFGVQLEDCDVFNIANCILRNQGAGTMIFCINLVSSTNGLVAGNLYEGTILDDGTNTMDNNISI